MRFPRLTVHRTLASVFALLALSAIAFGQYHERALERARSVKMLTDDREAVRKIFHDFDLDDSDETSDEFSFGDTQVEVTYSSGTCDEDENEIWNVAAGRVINVEVSESAEWKVVDLKLNLSKLEKEQNRRDDEG